MLAHVISLVVGLKNGLGTSPPSAIEQEDPGSLETAGSATLAAHMLLIIALALAKGSTIMFVQRILSRDLRQLYLTCYALLAVFAVWAIGSMIALGVDCEGTSYVAENMAAMCGHQGTRWAVISTLDASTELLLILMPSVIVWPLQLSFSLKVQVVTAFAFRVGYVALLYVIGVFDADEMCRVAALAVAHAVYSARTSTNPRPGLAFVPALALAEAELCWSLISATIPNLKSFMKSFNTGFGHNDFGFTSNPTMSASRRHPGGDEIPLRSLASHKDGLRPDCFAYDAEVVRGRDDRSIESGNSQELIIRKTVEHEVTFEGDRASKSMKGGRKHE
jgi:hypothetical protein